MLLTLAESYPLESLSTHTCTTRAPNTTVLYPLESLSLSLTTAVLRHSMTIICVSVCLREGEGEGTQQLLTP